MIEGLFRIPLRRFEDERGWFAEIRRESLLPKQTRQTNLSFSRKGVLRGAFAEITFGCRTVETR